MKPTLLRTVKRWNTVKKFLFKNSNVTVAEVTTHSWNYEKREFYKNVIASREFRIYDGVIHSSEIKISNGQSLRIVN